MGIQPLKITFTAYVFILVLFTSCRYGVPVHQLDINKQLDSISKKALQSHSPITPFPLCDLLPVKDWDAIVVIGPYSNEESFEGISIKNFNAVKDSLLAMSNNDGKCTLAYIKNKDVIGYSIISRKPIDFCRYNQNNYLIKRSACDLAELKKTADRLQVISTSAK